MIEKMDFYIGMAIVGILNGIFGPIGNYIANKHFIRRMEKVEKQADEKIKQLKELIKNGKKNK